MKITIKTGITALVLLLALSCKKENISTRSLPATDNSSSEALLSGIDNITGNNTIKIGSQVWRSINLNLDHYRNGDSIPQVTDPTAWATLTTGAWCYFNNDPAMGAIYGKLYNWYAVNDPRGLAPAGWHVPDDREWKKMFRFLGWVYVAGGSMKVTGTTYWAAPNDGATNSSGFTGLPGGYREFNGLCNLNLLHYNGYWWSATEGDTSTAQSYYLYAFSDDIGGPLSYKQSGFYVRCVKD